MRRLLPACVVLLLNVPAILTLSIAFILTACGGGSASGGGTPPPPPPPSSKVWTWMSGSNTANASGVYGSQGVAAAGNVPGGRWSAISWIDSSGNFWLFGGNGLDSTGVCCLLNDLWEFNPTAKQWIWVSGSNTAGVATTSNVPGGRYAAVSWTDTSGNLWLFGGYGTNGSLNDLWEFNPTAKTWTFVSGSGGGGARGVYGTRGVASTNNVPGARTNGVAWTDSSSNLWLFGGSGYDSVGVPGDLNDLWEFNPSTTEWTWVGGSNTANAIGVYGTLGVASTSNVPGGRWNAVSWTDRSGNFWLFGGNGYDSTGVCCLLNDLNDLWEFNPSTTEWTWVGGSNTANAQGVYGTQGTGSASNVPGSRLAAVSWIDSSNNLWLFGGFYTGSGGASEVSFNDLWEFNAAAKTWTWVSGSNTGNAIGVYGTLGIAAATNFPGARSSAVSWIDSSGNLWLFGGSGYDSAGTNGNLNDLWRYQP
jgi:N-acetylneuraminic acid mutarotase